jgi:hypothetical protein
MLVLYRSLLSLYPAVHRSQYGEEMLSVLADLERGLPQENLRAKISLRIRETGGLLSGALTEHSRQITGFYGNSVLSRRRFRMRPEFRFPKATPVLMTIILVAVLMTIEKAKAISASLPPSSTPVGAIQPEHLSTLTTFLVILAMAVSTAAIGWLVVFALRRTGMQRLSDVRPSGGVGSSGPVA